MTDIATIARRAHDTGFEQGSLAACNAILTYMRANSMRVEASLVLAAWEDGSIAQSAGLDLAGLVSIHAQAHDVSQIASLQSSLDAASSTDLGPPQLTREQATQSGFTGNSCNECGSLQMVRNGSCEKCNACGATTGCS